jgi:hypothetical protein
MKRKSNLRSDLVAICRYVGKSSTARPARPQVRLSGVLAELAEIRGLT